MRLFSLVLLVLFPLCAPAQSLQEVTLVGDRSYLFARPEGDGAVPLIVALHGGGGNPDQFNRVSRIAEKALAAGFAIALPAGTGGRAGRLKTWNAGYCCAAAQREGVDDIAFLDAVIADAKGRGGTGPVFLTGMSNGAMMAQTYAAQRAGRVAGVASVSGTMDAAHLRVAGPVPMMHIHGTADPMVPFAGGQGESSLTRTDFASVEDVLADFRAPFGAMDTGRKSWMAGGYGFERTAWSKGGHEEVVLIVIKGGDHEWPGGRRAEDQALDASDTVIAFFKAQMR